MYSAGVCTVPGCVQCRGVYSDEVCTVPGCGDVLMFSVIVKLQQIHLSVVHSW